MRKHLLLLLTVALATPMIYGSCTTGSCCDESSCSISSPCCDDGCEVGFDCCDDCADCKCITTGKTFFSVRPLWQSASPERVSLFRDKTYMREDGKGGAMQLGFFFSKSTDKAGLRSYFFPKNKNKLTVKEEISDSQLYGPTGEADLHPQHFRVVSKNWLASATDVERTTELATPFESAITMCPYQSVIGLGFAYRQNLTKLMNDDAENMDYHWWCEVSTPLTRVKNNLRLQEKFETDMEQAGGVVENVTGLDEDYLFFSSMKEAFKQKAWNYGKIDGCRKKTRLADIELKLGGEWVRKDSCRLEGYWGVLIPTGTRPSAEYVFEPIIGHNKHFGIISGGTACFKVWEDMEEGKSLRIAADSNGMYLFKKCEKRSFDLKGRPWSRYMEVYANKEDADKAYAYTNASQEDAGFLYATPGINLFTQDMTIRPRISCTSNLAMIYHNEDKGFSAEIGYNFFCRQRECVELKCVWKEEAALKSFEGEGTTSIFREIDFDASLQPDLGSSDNIVIDHSLDEFEHSIIKLEDLDLESAAHPGIASHTFYLTLGKRWEEREYPLFMNGGFSYEYGSDNTAMSRWLISVKGGISF